MTKVLGWVFVVGAAAMLVWVFFSYETGRAIIR